MDKVEKTTTRPKRAELVAERDELNQEYRDLGIEARAGSHGAQSRQADVAKRLRELSAQLLEREPTIEIRVPRSTTGHPFRIGDAAFHPGTHRVKKTVAQHLTYMIDRDREAELNRLRSNGEQVDLGAIGDKARQLDEREW